MKRQGVSQLFCQSSWRQIRMVVAVVEHHHTKVIKVRRLVLNRPKNNDKKSGVKTANHKPNKPRRQRKNHKSNKQVKQTVDAK